MDKITKGHLLSMSEDVMKANIEKLKKLFPEIVKEGKIDLTEFEALISEQVESKDEFYRMNWAGKSDARREANKPTSATLLPSKDESLSWESTKNIFIEGDNLEVLKLLQKSYSNRIKMIYIDPPYNTGKDFVYKDNYSDNLSNYLSLSGQSNTSGIKLSTNVESDGRFHSNWLNMIYPRLKLARNLLNDSGVILISIDDAELYNLKKVCDEIFGEENFVVNIVVNRTSEIASNTTVSKHEYILAYSKNISKFKVTGIEKYTISRGTVGNPDQTMPEIEFPAGLKCYGIKDGIYPSTRKIEGSAENIENLGPIIVKNGILAEPVKLKAKWRSSNDMRNFFDNNCQPTEAKISGIIEEIYFENDKFNPQIKKLTYEKIPSIIDTNKRGSLDIEELGLGNCFDFPKSVSLIQGLIRLIKFQDDDIILDFFAGSGTTAHATMSLSSIDGVKRNYITVQLPESLQDGNPCVKNGFKTIADISKERIKRASKKIENGLKEKIRVEKQKRKTELNLEDLNTLTSSKKSTEEILGHIDLGVRIFKLSTSNINSWNGSLDNLEQSLFDAITNIKSDRSGEDVLYEVLLKYGLDLTVPIQEKQINGHNVYSVGFGALFVCVSDNITTEVAEGIGKWKEELNPTTCRVLFRDNGFKDDVAKTNSIQILKRYGINEINSL